MQDDGAQYGRSWADVEDLTPDPASRRQGAYFGWRIALVGSAQAVDDVVDACLSDGMLLSVAVITADDAAGVGFQSNLTVSGYDALVIVGDGVSNGSGGGSENWRRFIGTASAIRPTIFICVDNNPDTELGALAAGAHAALSAATLTSGSLRSMLQTARAAFELRNQVKDGEDRLSSALRTVQAARQHRLAFLKHISHEFRTPLNAIIGFSELLARRADGGAARAHSDAIARGYIDDIRVSGGDLLALIEDLMLLAHVESLSATPLDAFSGPDLIEHCVWAVDTSVASDHPPRHEIGGILGDVNCDQAMVAQAVRALSREAGLSGPESIGLKAERVGNNLRLGVVSVNGWIDPETGFADAWPKSPKLQRELSLSVALSNSVARLHGGDLIFERLDDGRIMAGMALPISN